jgi:hypothetical protein
VQNQKRRHTITTYLVSRKLFSANVSLDHSPLEKEQTNTTSISDTASDIIDLVDGDLDSTRAVSPTRSITPDASPCPSPIVAHKNNTRCALVDPDKTCAKCKQCKFNNACSQHLCKACCIESIACCSLTDHAREKKGVRQPYSINFPATDAPTNQQAANELERRICEIIAAKKCVFISFQSDGLCCDIEPYIVEEGKESLLVQAMDHTRNGSGHSTLQRFCAWRILPGKPQRKVSHVLHQHLHTNFASVTAPVTTTPLPSTPLQWLQEFRMERYALALKKNGYDSFHLISVIDKSDLDTLGILISPHRKLFLVKVKDLFCRLNVS